MLNELTYRAILALIVRINQRICIMFCVLAKHCIIFFPSILTFQILRQSLKSSRRNDAFVIFIKIFLSSTTQHFSSIRVWRNFYHENLFKKRKTRLFLLFQITWAHHWPNWNTFLTLQPFQTRKPTVWFVAFFQCTIDQCFSTYRDNTIFFLPIHILFNSNKNLLRITQYDTNAW